MSTQTIFSARPYKGEVDVQGVWELYQACEAVDRLDMNDSLEALRLENNMPDIDPERNLRVWEDAEGKIVGFVRLDKPNKDPGGETISTRTGFRVHPSARNQGLEREILEWAERQLHEMAAGENLPGILYSGTRDFDTYGRELLESNGYQPARYFFRMARSLNEPIPESVFPPGYSLGFVKDTDEQLKEWVDCFNESFIDHWNHHPIAFEEARYWNDNNPYYAPENDLVALAPDGQFAAFCYCEIDEENNRRNNRLVGWIHLLGTRRGHRNQGLGTAMLYAGFRRLKAVGMDTAKLGVDADSLTGAVRLYEKVGFRTEMTNVVYSKRV